MTSLPAAAENGRDAGTDFFSVEQDGTGSALRQAAAELRAGQLEFVAQNVEQRGIAR